MSNEKFHNPYNFVPFGSEGTDGLVQGEPPGHSAYKTDLFEGSIEIELEAVSPLLLFDPSKMKMTVRDKHKTLDLLKMPDGKPIPASNIAQRCVTCGIRSHHLFAFRGS